MVGGIESSCLAVTTSSSAGPSCASISATAPGRSPGSSTRTRVDAHGARHGGEVGVVQVGAGVDEARRLHLQRDEAERRRC